MSLLSLSKKILRSSTKKSEKKEADKKKAPKEKAAKKDKPAAFGDTVLAGAIDLSVIMSEKSIKAQEQKTILVRVKHQATKHDIARAVEGLFGVKVMSVRTLVSHPKVRRRGLSEGQTNKIKKAYVTVDDISKLNVTP